MSYSKNRKLSIILSLRKTSLYVNLSADQNSLVTVRLGLWHTLYNWFYLISCYFISGWYSIISNNITSKRHCLSLHYSRFSSIPKKYQFVSITRVQFAPSTHRAHCAWRVLPSIPLSTPWPVSQSGADGIPRRFPLLNPSKHPRKGNHVSRGDSKQSHFGVPLGITVETGYKVAGYEVISYKVAVSKPKFAPWE